MSMHLSYWQPKLPYLTYARAEYLKANVGKDPALLPEDLGASEMYVRRIQRKLGLRKRLNTPRKGDSNALRCRQ
jgi:hypothetical protein